jgi:hypothetical protein
MVVLMLSVFTVSMGFGVVLPLLPYLIERLLGTGVDAAQVSRSTGLLTGLYTLSLFLFAPAWGRMSDRYGRRRILLIGLIGFSATMLTFAFIENLPAVYAERFLSGMFAAAVTPVAMAAIGDLASDRRGAGAPPHLRQPGRDQRVYARTHAGCVHCAWHFQHASSRQPGRATGLPAGGDRGPGSSRGGRRRDDGPSNDAGRCRPEAANLLRKSPRGSSPSCSP